MARRRPFNLVAHELQRAARKFGTGPNGAQLKALAASEIPIELVAELIKAQHLFGRAAVWELITARVLDVVFGRQYFDDAATFTVALLDNLRLCGIHSAQARVSPD